MRADTGNCKSSAGSRALTQAGRCQPPTGRRGAAWRRSEGGHPPHPARQPDRAVPRPPAARPSTPRQCQSRMNPWPPRLPPPPPCSPARAWELGDWLATLALPPAGARVLVAERRYLLCHLQALGAWQVGDRKRALLRCLQALGEIQYYVRSTYLSADHQH